MLKTALHCFRPARGSGEYETPTTAFFFFVTAVELLLTVSSTLQLSLAHTVYETEICMYFVYNMVA